MGASGIEYEILPALTHEEYYMAQTELDNTPTINAPTIDQPVVEDELFPVSKGWEARVMCVGANIKLFKPDRSTVENEKRAKAVCSTCPVKVDCLNYGFKTETLSRPWGVIAGLNGRERAKVYKGMKAAKEAQDTSK